MQIVTNVKRETTKNNVKKGLIQNKEFSVLYKFFDECFTEERFDRFVIFEKFILLYYNDFICCN